MTYQKFPSSTFPFLRTALGLRKRSCIVTICESVTFRDLNWSGGTRSQYAAIDLATYRAAVPKHLGDPPPWDNPYEGLVCPLQPGIAIVEYGYFCGKPSTPCIYIHPSDVTPALTA